MTPKDDTTFGKDHDQRPRFGADEIISALSPHPRSEGHRPHCSETLALTTISFLNFPGAVSTRNMASASAPGSEHSVAMAREFRSSPPRCADGGLSASP